MVEASDKDFPDKWETRSLVLAAGRGDQGAFGRLYELYGKLVHGILLSRVPADQAEDLTQDVFLTAMRRLDTLRDPEAFGGWLSMIARNRAVDYHRADQRRAVSPVELRDDMATQNPAPPEALAVLDVIRGLPEAFRETLVLRLVEGMTGPEIADRTGLTHESVRVNLHRGMKMLREKLGGESQ
ncbi:MAG: sigma-70 family RNA polymerase sigma factor [Bryobacterales bacterium]|nr:sigma-70 family RNA polymerase sigma factor [Bryobacterales bacterium]